MRRETQHLLLLLLGGVLLRIAADDTYLRYVRQGHRILLIGAGAVVVLLAVVALVRDLRGTPQDDGHEHGSAERAVPWLLLAPVLVIALVAPPALGADAVSRAADRNAVLQDYVVFPPLPPGPAPELPVGEFVQRAALGEKGGVEGREVSLVGFAVRSGSAVELARLSIACCAADARPNKVRLVGELGNPASDTWLRVRGIVAPGTSTAATGYVPTVTVTGFDVIDAPVEPYED